MSPLTDSNVMEEWVRRWNIVENPPLHEEWLQHILREEYGGLNMVVARLIGDSERWEHTFPRVNPWESQSPNLKETK